VIEGWLKAIRDHPQRPAAMQRHVLTMLALRMDWATGAGFAGIRDLMADADASKSTVMRGTSWARDEHFLIRTRRGHYISAQTTIASQWQLTQGVTTETLGQSQGVNGSEPRCQPGQPKVSVGTTHQESSSSESSSSPRASAADTVRAAFADVTGDEIETIIETVRSKYQPRNLPGYIATLAAKGELRRPCDQQGTTRHSQACRDGQSGSCGADWCECRCHPRKPAEAAP
jgi:hypothetical protein